MSLVHMYYFYAKPPVCCDQLLISLVHFFVGETVLYKQAFNYDISLIFVNIIVRRNHKHYGRIVRQPKSRSSNTSFILKC